MLQAPPDTLGPLAQQSMRDLRAAQRMHDATHETATIMTGIIEQKKEAPVALIKESDGV